MHALSERHRRVHYGLTTVLLALSLALPLAALAQSDADDAGSLSSLDEGDVSGSNLSRDEATRLLAQPLPDAQGAPDARYAALQRQYRAALLLEERARLIATARELVDAGRGRPGGESWITTYLDAEFTWGSSGKALEVSEAFVTDSSLSLGQRAAAALRQTYFAAQGTDRALMARLW